jgi:hypothetical protein
MSVPKNIYVGKRYIPKQCGDWDNTKNTVYESLSVVLYQGASYTSKQDVPKGIDIGNILYWVKSADYNAQVAIYEQNVRDYHQYVIDQIGLVNQSFSDFIETQQANYDNFYLHNNNSSSTLDILNNIEEFSIGTLIKTNYFYNNQNISNNNSYVVSAIDGTENFVNINNEFLISANGELKSLNNNNKKLKVLFNKSINLLALGIKEGIDVSTIMQTCLNISKSLIFPNGNWTINKTCFIEYYHNIECNNSTFICSNKDNLTKNTLFSINSLDLINAKIKFTGTYGSIKNFSIDVSNFADSIIGIFSGCAFIFENMFFRGIKQAIVFSNDYMDNIIINNIRIYDCDITYSHDFYIYKEKGGGECFTINKLQCMGGNILKIGESYNIEVNNAINGCYIINSGSVIFNNLHIEEGFINTFNCSTVINDSFFYKPKDLSIIPIKTRGNGFTTQEPLIIRNCTFNSAFWRKYTTVQQYSIDFDIYQDVTIENCYSYDLTLSNQTITNYYKDAQIGILVLKNGVDFSDFNTNSSLLSRDCKIIRGDIYTKIRNNILGLSSVQLLKPITLGTSGNKWLANSDTYTYDAILLIDYNRRIQLKNTNPVSASVTKDGDGLEILLQQLGYVSPCSIAIYRKGSGDSAYTKYAVIPLTSYYENKTLNDDGLFINGIQWQSINVATLTNTGNNITFYELDLLNKNVVCKAPSYPTLGNWLVGDKVINSLPSVGQPRGWICSVGGATPTFISEGNY